MTKRKTTVQTRPATERYKNLLALMDDDLHKECDLVVSDLLLEHERGVKTALIERMERVEAQMAENEAVVDGLGEVVTRLAVPPVSVNVLRAIPVASLAALAVTRSENSRMTADDHRSAVTTVDATNALGSLAHLPPLEQVAVVYRWGYFIGENPTQWVAAVLEMSYAVAAKRVQAARLAGLLEPTAKGRKGA